MTPDDVARRTVLRSAAWAVPVVALAVAAPVAAASGGTGPTGTNQIVLDPEAFVLIGGGTNRARGTVVQDGGTMPLLVELAVTPDEARPFVTVSPERPTVSESGAFEFTYTGTPSGARTDAVIVATPVNAAGTTFTPGRNTLTLTVHAV